MAEPDGHGGRRRDSHPRLQCLNLFGDGCLLSPGEFREEARLGSFLLDGRDGGLRRGQRPPVDDQHLQFLQVLGCAAYFVSDRLGERLLDLQPELIPVGAGRGCVGEGRLGVASHLSHHVGNTLRGGQMNGGIDLLIQLHEPGDCLDKLFELFHSRFERHSFLGDLGDSLSRILRALRIAGEYRANASRKREDGPGNRLRRLALLLRLPRVEARSERPLGCLDARSLRLH